MSRVCLRPQDDERWIATLREWGPSLPEQRGADPGRDSVRQRLTYVATLGLLGILKSLPYSASIRMAQGIGRACGFAVPKWRDTAERNLQEALPGLSPAERKRIIREVYRNLGRVAFALANLPTWSEHEVRKHVVFAGLEHFREGQARGRGVMLLTAHLGNWELGALAHGAVEGPVHVMVRPIDNPLVDRLVQRLRSSHGNRVISKRRSARQVLQVLRQNGTVGILADQNAVREEAVFVDFFGIPAASTKGFAQLALRSGAAVIPAVAWWEVSSARHIVEYGPAIDVIRTDDASMDIEVNTQRFQRALEDRVRSHPEQWLWIHRRWKTRPPSE